MIVRDGTGSDDDAGLLVDLADQMEEQCAAGHGKRNIAHLLKNPDTTTAEVSVVPYRLRPRAEA